jgi:hypothetical protein
MKKHCRQRLSAEEGITICSIAVVENKCASIRDSLAVRIVITESLQHLQKQDAPSNPTLAGISISEIAAPENARASIAVNREGGSKETEERARQSRKDDLQIVSTDRGITIEQIPVRRKACSSMRRKRELGSKKKDARQGQLRKHAASRS